MAKHRKHNRAEKKASRRNSSLVSSFFETILPFIEKLEKEDNILLVIPTEENNNVMGCVLSSELSNLINVDYVTRMAEGTRLCGSLEKFLELRSRDRKFASKHNPDQMLLNICQAARLVIAYRYGLKIGSREYLAEQKGEEIESTFTAEGWGEGQPLFITMMSDEEDTPQSVGYELNGTITLENYNSEEN